MERSCTSQTLYLFEILSGWSDISSRGASSGADWVGRGGCTQEGMERLRPPPAEPSWSGRLPDRNADRTPHSGKCAAATESFRAMGPHASRSHSGQEGTRENLDDCHCNRKNRVLTSISKSASPLPAPQHSVNRRPSRRLQTSRRMSSRGISSTWMTRLPQVIRTPRAWSA